LKNKLNALKKTPATETISEIIVGLVILLFVYAAVSKLANFDLSRRQMLIQVFPLWLSAILVWAIPLAELIAATMLLFSNTMLRGLYLSCLLMTVFTGYIALVLLHLFKKVPCSCGGILQHMSWETHLVFNAVFLILIIVTIILKKKGGLVTKMEKIKL
jgi:putative oxidoreductase